MEELDEDSRQRRETFARYGLAMYHAQCVEKSLAILVSSVFNKDYLPSPPEHRDEILDEVFSRTIGTLLFRLKQQVSIPPNLDRTLEEARQKRNWLAHEYFWARAGEILTNRGRDKMLEELDSLSDFFSNVDTHLVSIYDRWMAKVGVPQSLIKDEIAKLIKENE